MDRVPQHQLGNSVHRYFLQTRSFLICIYLCSRRIGEDHQSRSCRGLSYFCFFVLRYMLGASYVCVCFFLLLLFQFHFDLLLLFVLCFVFFLLLQPERGLSVALLSTLHQKLYKVKAMEELWIGGP